MWAQTGPTSLWDNYSGDGFCSAFGIWDPSYGRMSGGNVFDLSDIGTPLSLQGEQKSIYMPAG